MDKGVFPGQGNPIRHTTPKILQMLYKQYI